MVELSLAQRRNARLGGLIYRYRTRGITSWKRFADIATAVVPIRTHEELLDDR